MIYADTDYLLALLKPSDWLKKRAMRLQKDYAGKIWTSQATIVELVLVCKRENLDIDLLVEQAFKLVTVRGITVEQALEVTFLLVNEGMTPFDAFHVALSGDNPILSSDTVYEKVGKECISLRE